MPRLNEHSSARLIKLELQKVQKLIIHKRFGFVVNAKGRDDIQTDADTSVEALIADFVDECYGVYSGIIGEEKIRRKPRGRSRSWKIVDPLDGTKAFARNESYGISSLLSIYEGNEVTSSYIMNPYTDELFYFRAKSPNTWHFFKDEAPQQIVRPEPKPLSKCIIGLRSDVRIYSPFIQDLTLPVEVGGIIKDSRGYSGSFALMIMDLVRGIIQQAIVKPGPQKPWDCAAPWSFMNRFGIKAYRVDAKRRKLIEFPLIFSTSEIEWHHETIFALPEVIDQYRTMGMIK